jgi:hypothetical protein
MAALQEAGQSELIEWVKEVCLSRAENALEYAVTDEGVKRS